MENDSTKYIATNSSMDVVISNGLKGSSAKYQWRKLYIWRLIIFIAIFFGFVSQVYLNSVHCQFYWDSVSIENNGVNQQPLLSNNKKPNREFAKEDDASDGPDIRTTIDRPFMETTSHTIIDSFHDIEKTYKPTESCSKWGGAAFIQKLDQSLTPVLSPRKNDATKDGHSQIFSFQTDDINIYYAENISVVINVTTPYKDLSVGQPFFQLEVNGRRNDAIYNERMYHEKSEKNPGTVLQQMSSNIVEKNELRECYEYIEYPVMLVDNNIDTWNWWFFLQAILHHYVAMGMVQPMIIGRYRTDPMRVLFTSPDKESSRSFLDAFEFLFSDGRKRDSRQIWKVAGSSDTGERRYCFRKMIWSPKTSIGSRLLINKAHPQSDCFSSIIYSYAAYLKAAMHIPTLPRPELPRVVWVGRDTSQEANPSPWQKRRIISNQDELTSYLKDQCNKIGVDFIVADFYGDKKDTSFQEQALFVSKANVMIGMHGAGLNMFHFMPFNSVVVEIHRHTKVQRNSWNFVNHVREAAYLKMEATILDGAILKEPVWAKLQEAISKWKSLG